MKSRSQRAHFPKVTGPAPVGVGAFTLVELLVVVAIIGILAALAFAPAKKMISRAQGVACMSNLKQISAGLVAYAADNDGKLPPAANLASPSGQWYNVLEPYIGGGNLSWNSTARPKWQQCPSQRFPKMSALTVGYGWNYENFGHDDWDGPGQANGGAFSRMAQVPRPARTIIIGDSCDSTDPADDFRHRYIYSSASFLWAQRHDGRGNYLFLDGHVESLTPAQLLSAKPSLFVKDK